MSDDTTDVIDQINEYIETVECEIEDVNETDEEDHLMYSEGKLQGLKIARSVVIHCSQYPDTEQ